MKNLIVAILLLLIVSTLSAQDNNTPVSFTLGDRDRLMRNEQKLESLQKEMNARFENVDVKFESLQKEMNFRFESLQKEMNFKFEAQQKQLDNIYILLFFILGAIMSLIGFVIYDRRTALKPVQKEQQEIIKVLSEYSKGDKKLQEILKNTGIL